MDKITKIIQMNNFKSATIGQFKQFNAMFDSILQFFQNDFISLHKTDA